MLDKFRRRSYQLEHLDKGDYSPEEYEGCIVELQQVNEWLGDARALGNTLFKEIDENSLQCFSLLDVGAGSGELLRVTICSLFTHHFAENQIVDILREMSRVARRKIFVIDLHRHPVAYYFYTTIGKLFLRNRLIREDGALSILRGFKPEELFTLAKDAGLENISVARHFPYRLVLSATAPRSERRQHDSTAGTGLTERAA